MIRTLALLVRRPDIDRETFRRHYESVHTPLALQSLVGLRRYVRNHVVEVLDGPDPPFDVLTEFAYADHSSVEQTMAMLASSEAGERIRRDELEFMDKPRNAFFEVEAWQPGGDPVQPPQQGASKLALLVGPADESPGASAPEVFDMELSPLLHGAIMWESWRLLPKPKLARPWRAVAFVWLCPERVDAFRSRLSGWLAAPPQCLRVEEHASLPG
ncbi:MAG: EthD domain-containing protein [Deltaproteobacteria bacterium]|nr:EthD domain-containing protein [Deltaproteobacteria bacterium]